LEPSKSFKDFKRRHLRAFSELSFLDNACFEFKMFKISSRPLLRHQGPFGLFKPIRISNFLPMCLPSVTEHSARIYTDPVFDIVANPLVQPCDGSLWPPGNMISLRNTTVPEGIKFLFLDICLI